MLYALRGSHGKEDNHDDPMHKDKHGVELLEDFVLMKESDQAFWRCRFVCEAKVRIRRHTPPPTPSINVESYP